MAVPFKKQTAVCGWSILGFEILGETWGPSSRPSTTSPLLHIFDTTFTYVGRIEDYESFMWQYNWYEADKFEFTINRYKTNVSEITPNGFVAFIDENDAWHVGIIRTVSKPLTQDGKQSETWTFTGKSYESVFEDRICISKVNVGTGYDDQSDNTETNMKYFVTEEAYDPDDTNRRITSLRMETDSGRGAVIHYRARGETLASLLQAHVKYDPIYSYYLDWNGYVDGSANRENFTFKIREGRDLTASVKLSALFGNIYGYDYRYSSMGQKNWAYVGGTGDGAARTVVDWGVGVEPTGRNRKEVWVDGRDCSDIKGLKDRAVETLNDMSENETCEFEFNPNTNSYVFLHDFKVGDVITVQVDNIITMYARVISATEEYTDRGRTVKLTVGKEWPDLYKVIRWTNKQMSGEIRR